MRWSELVSLAEQIGNSQASDNFTRLLLKGAMRVARSGNNPIRGNLFAAAMRELISHRLDKLAPKRHVERCFWYTQQPNTNGPARRQRFSYICHKGLSPDFVENELLIPITRLHGPLQNAFQQLHKATHVRPGTTVSSTSDVKKIIEDCFHAMETLEKAASRCEALVCQALIDHIHGAIDNKLMSATYNELDELSTHTRVDGHNIEEIHIVKIDHELIWYGADGSVDVELQYGSGSDVRNDMGFMKDDSFPYHAQLTARVVDPSQFISAETDLNIDNSSFFE